MDWKGNEERWAMRKARFRQDKECLALSSFESAFGHCDKIPEIFKLKGEKVYLGS